ncbi:uncharacterized protein N7482_006638 [Penicillium canariense]|uniref:Uncharacterized protein n=1 Tax=Penicillium canariense TaxID=189055 RepID=A0A9W9LJC3_9EURO|nr:uncharacterized protein N7482_006638 [Penicillium canariense]KAJ5159634.1 hypothetical protein N7482_006638 [Penicillium canariense]
MRAIPPSSTRRPPARFARRYGAKFNSFDHLANVSLCSQELGQVEIDCRFRQSKTQWGVLGPAENQAGILYMDLGFTQPKDCRLSNAVVWISLEEMSNLTEKTSRSKEPEKPSTSRSPANLGPTKVPNVRAEEQEEYDTVRFLQFTHDFGPRQLAGEPTKATTKKTTYLTPHVNVLGNGGGGLGWDREQTIEQTSQWLFTGNLLRGSKLGSPADDIVYRTLKWELSEDDFQPQPTHSNTIQTAFTLEHDMETFAIRIEIQGKLQRRHERVKNHVKHLFRFPKDPRQKQGISWTAVLPDESQKARRRLDAIVQGLPFDMERLNLEAVRPQVPTSLPVSFQKSAQASRDESMTTSTAVEDNDTSASATNHTAAPRLPHFRPPERIASFPEEEKVTIGRLPTQEIPVKSRTTRPAESPMRERFATARHHPEHSPSQTPVKRRNERYEEMFRDSQVEEILASKAVRISPKMERAEEQGPDDDLNELASQLAQFPFLLRILVWVISMMTFIPNKAPKKTLKGD